MRVTGVAMHPVLFDVWGFAIHGYGAMAALGFVLGCGVVFWRAHQRGMDVNRLADAIFVMALSGLAGSRLVFVLQHPELIEGPLDLFDVRGGGLVFYGALITATPVGLWMLHRGRLPVLATFDVFATGVPLAHGISRVGCFLAGCCWGVPSDGPLAVTFPAGSALAPGGVPLHPVQLYEATSLVALAGVTNLLYPHRRFDGQVFAVYVLLYAVLRSVTETFRGDLARGFFLPELLGESLSFSQGLSLLLGLGALVFLVRGARAVGRGHGPPSR